MFSLKQKISNSFAKTHNENDENDENLYDQEQSESEPDDIDCIYLDLKKNPYLEEFNDQHFGYSGPGKSQTLKNLSFLRHYQNCKNQYQTFDLIRYFLLKYLISN